MCDFLCLGIATEREVASRLEAEGIYARECTDTPIGRVVVGGKAARRAYFLTDGPCSCALFHNTTARQHSRRQKTAVQLRELLLTFIRECLEAQHSVPLLRHWMPGNAWTEQVSPVREARVTLEELAEAWLTLEPDVRYVVLADWSKADAGSRDSFWSNRQDAKSAKKNW